MSANFLRKSRDNAILLILVKNRAYSISGFWAPDIDTVNIFDLPPKLPAEECFEPLASGDKVLIERIISTGQITPVGEWYNQDRDEWVILLQGDTTLGYFDGSNIQLKAGD